MAETGALKFLDIVIDGMLIVAGIAIAWLLFYAHRRFGGGALSDFVRWMVWGIVFFALEQVFEKLVDFFPALEQYKFAAEHALMIAGFAFVCLAAWELHKISHASAAGRAR